MPILRALCEYKNVRGCSIKADVFLPSNANPPVVVHFHGGALISGSRKYLPAYQAKSLNQAGLAVVACDYRLAPETRLEDIITDIQDALGWVRTEGASLFGWNANRVAVMGGSAGGYLSLMSGTFTQKPKAVVSFYGYGDILGEWYTRPSEFYCRRPLISREEAVSSVGVRPKSVGGSRRYTFYFYCRQQGIWPEAVSGWHPDAERDKLLRYSPVNNIEPDYPPTLLLHGDQDTDVPFEQSVQMAAALEQRGIQHQLVLVKGAGHGFDGDRKNQQVSWSFDSVVEFLQRHI